ncbi:MAG TPA: CpsD/CapB family tyrosine-protein kinase, partial [Acidimicrobiales bacterium]|nr:CpsD/CapB family tyrosine-protein kinase [Acidimicrobiales bacterium]
GFLARSYARLALTRPVLAQAVSAGRLTVGPSEALDLVAADSTGDGFVHLTAEGGSPSRAEALATAVAAALTGTVEARQQADREAALAPAAVDLAELERQLSARELAPDAPQRQLLLARYQELQRAVTDARLAPLDRVRVVSPARAATSPVEPQPPRDGLLTFLGALVAFAAVAVVVEALSDRFSAERPGEEVTRLTGLPVLAEIPRAGGTDVVEAFRTLRTGLMFMSTAERLRTLAVVSVEPGVGKSFTALHLARQAAALEVPVVLIDGDLRRPLLHERLRVPREPGLSEVLAGLSEAGTGHVVDGWLRVVPSGSPVPDPSGLFAGPLFRDLLAGLSWAELVVVDTPAGGLFADALAIASQCDATLVVVDAQNSRRRLVRHLVDNLRQVNALPLGVVLNRTEPVPRPSYYETRAGRPRSRSGPAAGGPAAGGPAAAAPHVSEPVQS